MYKKEDYTDKLVAFLDILGYSKLIRQDKAASIEIINKLDDHIDNILTILRDDYGETFSTKLFSDCICVSCEYNYENVFYIIYELAFIQLYLSFEGIFLRGGLSRGNHFENERIIFSRGLVTAYELEQLAIYPRIIIDDNLLGCTLTDNTSYSPVYGEFKKKDFLIKSTDGKYFIDYLNMVSEVVFEQEESLETHKKSILTSISDNLNDIDVMGKYRWLAEYHNYKVNELFKSNDWEESHYNKLIQETAIDLQSNFPQFSKRLSSND